jgi:phosphate transport system substrate-binding protein
LKLTIPQLFLALARQTPKDGKLIDNPYVKWSDIDPALPAQKIEVYGPPPTSGTRDAFVELLMERACATFPEFKAAHPGDKERSKACGLLREDGHYIEAGENDNLIVQKLASNPNALGLFGFSYLEENHETIQGSSIDGQTPDVEHIITKRYPLSRPLFVYVKNAHRSSVPGMNEFISELTSKSAMGNEGYLAAKGLIPLKEDERQAVEKAAKAK